MTKLAPVHPGNRIELPPDWAAEIGLSRYVALEKTGEGILVHPFPIGSWDDLFAQKLRPGSAADVEEVNDVTGDGLFL